MRGPNLALTAAVSVCLLDQAWDKRFPPSLDHGFNTRAANSNVANSGEDSENFRG